MQFLEARFRCDRFCVQLPFVEFLHDAAGGQQVVNGPHFGGRKMTEIRRKRDLETRVEYRPGLFRRPVAVRQLGGSRQRQEQQAAGQFNGVFHGLVREFGRQRGFRFILQNQ